MSSGIEPGTLGHQSIALATTVCYTAVFSVVTQTAV